MARLEHKPHLVGSPLTREGRIVGIVISPVDNANEVEVVPVSEVRGFLGRDLPAPTRMAVDLKTSIYQVKAER